MSVLSILIFVLLPGILIRAESRVKVISWLSPAFWCYALGILLGNILPLDLHMSELTQTAAVALAIPLLLFPSELKDWARLAGKTLLSFIIWVMGVAIMAIAAAFIWQDFFELPKAMASMASSVYTGGTANMSAVQFAIKAPSQLFDTMNLSDLSFSGLYLIFVLTAAQKLLLRFLPAFPKRNEEEMPEGESDTEEDIKLSIPSILTSLGWAVVVVGLSIGMSFLFFGKLEETFVVIALAVLGIAASTFPRIQKLPMSYHTGEYIFLIFCVAVGSRVDLVQVLQAVPVTLAFMGTIAFGTVCFHSFFAWLFKIDADTVLITHSAGIFGPPFIGPIATAMKNREIVLSGMTLGVINLAIGNFVGILIFNLLS